MLILDKAFNIVYSNRKINKFIGLNEIEKNTCFFQYFLDILSPNSPISLIEMPQILHNFLQNLDLDFPLKNISKKILVNIEIKAFFSDLKYVINEGLNARNSAFYQVLKQQTIVLTYKLNENMNELCFYSTDLKNEEKDHIIFFFTELNPDKTVINITNPVKSAINISNPDESPLNPDKSVINYVTNPEKSSKNLSLNVENNNIMMNISSELRQPIINVIEILEKLKIETKNANFFEYIDSAYQNAYLIYNYINGIFDFSLINSSVFPHKIHIVYMEYDITILLEHIISILRPIALRKNIELSYFIDKNQKKLIYTDPLRLMQILYNLLKNSIKFTDKGFVKLVISNETINNENSFIFEVFDSSSITFSQNSLVFLKENNYEFFNFEMNLMRKLINEISNFQNIVIKSSKSSGNHYKFMISSQNSLNLSAFIENLEDGLLESNYIEKKNKNIEIYKENLLITDKEISKNSSFSIYIPNKEHSFEFSLFKDAMNSHYCYFPKILLIFSDMLNIMKLQHILLNLGFLSDFSADFNKGISKIRERKGFQNCGKYCQNYEFLFIDGDLNENIGKLKEEEVFIVGFFENEEKLPEIRKKMGINGLKKNFEQEEIAKILREKCK